jgi:hypothetical protein
MLVLRQLSRVPRVRYSGRFAVYGPLHTLQHNEPPMRSESFPDQAPYRTDHWASTGLAADHPPSPLSPTIFGAHTAHLTM